MIRLFLASTAVVATPAQAHVGHLGGLAGHDHWIAGIAIGAAAGIAIWGALKGKQDPEADPGEGEEDPTEEEPA